MADHQVYVIWTNPLFHDSLRQLLDHNNINWVGAASDIQTAAEEILQLFPDTILIEDVEDKSNTNIFMNIVDQFGWDLQVIGVSLNDNELNIFQHAKQMVGKPEDLIRLITRWQSSADFSQTRDV